MSAKYIIRVDDASEYMDYSKWNPFFKLFEKYGIKPIIAVIPFNKDPKLINGDQDEEFWEKVRLWQSKGYRIGLHGFEHLYKTLNSGIIGLNKYSEFAGVQIEKQIKMLEKAYRKFKDEGIKVDIFVAPAHSFDRNTLLALRKATDIKIISDGFFVNPILKDDLKWIPQQLWGPENKSNGIWTICYHPETSCGSTVSLLDNFLKTHNECVVDPFSLEFNNMKFEDIIFSSMMKFYNRLRSNI
jgi:hypothetical protein